MSEQTVTMRLKGDASGLTPVMQKAKAEVSGLGTATNKTGGDFNKLSRETDGATQRQSRFSQAADRSQRSASNLGAAASSAGNLIRTLIGAAVIRQAVQLADAYSNIQSRLELVTKSEQRYAAARDQSYQIAQRTFTSLESTATLYGRIQQSADSLGRSQADALRVTELINKTFQISGTEAATASASIIQLAQGLSAGALRGDEFNSVMEGAPRLADALGASLGKTRGELRAMAEDGQITADVIIDAILKQGEAIDNEFARLEVTAGRGWQNVKNAALKSIGEISKEVGATAALGGGLQTLASGIERLPVVTGIWIESLRPGVEAVSDLIVATNEWLRLITGAPAVDASLFGHALTELTILPVSLRTAMTIAIGEVDKLRISALEQFDLLVNAGDIAWLALQLGVTTMAAEVKIVFAAAIDAVLARFVSMVETTANLASKVGAGALAESLRGLSSELQSTAGYEAKIRAELEQNVAAYDAEIAAVEQRRDGITATAEAQRALADSLIADSLAERDAALLQLSAEQALAEAEKTGTGIRKASTAATKADEAARKSAERAIRLQIKALLDERNALRALDGIIESSNASSDAMRQALAANRAEAEKLNDAVEVLLRNGPPTADVQMRIAEGYDAATDAARRRIDAAKDETDQARELESILSSFDDIGFGGLVRDMNLVRDALAEATDPAQIARLQSALVQLQAQVQIRNVASFGALLGAVQAFTEEGSSGFKSMERGMAALSIIQDIIALKAAVTAVLSQGQGDPYSAFARMAAMAAAVAPFLASIGLTLSSLGGGGFADTAAQRQESQGTGTVLGDAEAKSDSSLRAQQITADATSRLVGINTGMLRALQQLQAGIGSASGMLARGAADVDYASVGSAGFVLNSRNGAAIGAAVGSIIPVIGTAIGFVLGALIGKFLGGSSRTSDQGLSIGGGSVDDANLRAYQETQSRSWRFGSTRTRTAYGDVSEEFGAQFQLIIDSIVSTVREGALALGLLPAEIDAALAEYQIAETRISLMDLSAEEQQAELQAVFSSIFDGLAGSVVPFIAQFQRVGEGLGETLVRVATGVQVTQEAMARLGFSIDQTDPERFAQISEGLIEMAGGLDAFIEGMAAFIDAFAPEDYKFDLLLSDLTRAFDQVGLAVPATREEMWALRLTLDATTAVGQEQIATLFRLSGIADAYYTSLERRAEIAADAAADAAQEAIDTQERLAAAERELIETRTAGITALETMMFNLRRELSGLSEFGNEWLAADDWRAAAIASATAHAQAAGLAAARESDLATIEMRAAQMRAEAIAKLQSALTAAAVELGYIDAPDTLDYLNQRIAELESASTSAAAGIGEAVQSIIGELDLLLGNLSPFNDRQKLEIARGGLQNGSVTQEQFLTIAQRLFGGTARYMEEFNFASQYPGAASAGGVGALGGITRPQSTDTRSVEELRGLRDDLLEQQREQRAGDFARRLAELSFATGDGFAELAAASGFSLDQLGADLNLSTDQLIAYLDTLKAQFGADIYMNSAQFLADRITSETSRIVEAITNPFKRAGSLVTLPISGLRPELGAAGVSVPDDLDFSPEVGNGKPIFGAAPIITNAGLSTADPTTSEVAALRATVEAQSAELVAIRAALERIAGSTERSADADETTAGATTSTADSLDRIRRDQPTGARSDRGRGVKA